MPGRGHPLEGNESGLPDGSGNQPSDGANVLREQANLGRRRMGPRSNESSRGRPPRSLTNSSGGGSDISGDSGDRPSTLQQRLRQMRQMRASLAGSSSDGSDMREGHPPDGSGNRPSGEFNPHQLDADPKRPMGPRQPGRNLDDSKRELPPRSLTDPPVPSSSRLTEYSGLGNTEKGLSDLMQQLDLSSEDLLEQRQAYKALQDARTGLDDIARQLELSPEDLQAQQRAYEAFQDAGAGPSRVTEHLGTDDGARSGLSLNDLMEQQRAYEAREGRSETPILRSELLEHYREEQNEAVESAIRRNDDIKVATQRQVNAELDGVPRGERINEQHAKIVRYAIKKVIKRREDEIFNNINNKALDIITSEFFAEDLVENARSSSPLKYSEVQQNAEERAKNFVEQNYLNKMVKSTGLLSSTREALEALETEHDDARSAVKKIQVEANRVVDIAAGFNNEPPDY